jgi:hypothetical protein
VEVSLYNFGTDTQSNFDVELIVDGTSVATETYTGTLAPGSSDTFTFAQTIDISNPGQVYVVEASTDLSGDEYTPNDGFSKSYSSDPLSIDDNNFTERQLLVYPISNKVYEINYSTNFDFGAISYRVMNVLGQTVANGQLTNNGIGYKATVDMNTNSNGVYIVEISNGSQKASKKILVR